MGEDDNKNNDVSVWKMMSSVGKAVGKTVTFLATGTANTVDAANQGQKAIRNTMAVTEITTIFNTTDKIIKFMNRETARDSKEVLGQSSVTLRTDNTSGAWIPWYDPPRFGDFSKRHMEIVIDDIPVVYLWQKGDYIYWSNRLDDQGRPAKAYKMGGVAHIGGKRTLVIRNDPEAGYSVFLSNSMDGK